MNTTNNNGNNEWSNTDNNDSRSKEKSGSSKAISKKSSTAKDGDKATPIQKPYTRSYWKGDDTIVDSANSSKKRRQYTMPEDPIYTLSESKAMEFNVKHQVRGGKGSEQKKKTYKPLYLDNFDEPYAVFRFKYRSRGMFCLSFCLIFCAPS